jgi:nucleotide-binding universal stress UspA family protein
MFSRIFVPLDGSTRAERALDLSASLARQISTHEQAPETLLTLFQAIDLSSWMELDERQEEHTHALEVATRYLEEQAKGLRSQGITVETTVRLGNPAEAILEQSIACKAELIVMSTHGRTGLARWALGSVAERVARSATAPIVLLPDAAPATSMDAEVQHTTATPEILVPLDGSAKAEAALPVALEMAHLRNEDIRLLYVFVPTFEERTLEETHRTWDTDRRRVHQIERYLTRRAGIIQHAGIKAHWTFGYGLPGAKIIDTAHSHTVNLIVMTTQGRGGVMRGRLGRVAEEVLHSGLLPVALVPSAGVEADQSAEAQEDQSLSKEMLR